MGVILRIYMQSLVMSFILETLEELAILKNSDVSSVCSRCAAVRLDQVFRHGAAAGRGIPWRRQGPMRASPPEARAGRGAWA